MANLKQLVEQDAPGFSLQNIAENFEQNQRLQTLEANLANATGPLTYKGQWDAATNTPDLNTFSLGTQGEYLLATSDGTVTIGGVSKNWKKDDLAIWNAGATRYDQQPGGGIILARLLALEEELGGLFGDLPSNPYGIIWAVMDPIGKCYLAVDDKGTFYNTDYQSTKALLAAISDRMNILESNFQPIDPNPYGITFAKTDPTGKVYEGQDKFAKFYNPDYLAFKTLVTGFLPSIQSAAVLAAQFVPIDPNPYGIIEGKVDPTGKVFEATKSDGTKRGLWFDNVATGGAALTEVETRMLLGKHLFVVKDRWFQIYGYPMLATRNLNNTAYTFALQSTNAKGEAYQELFHSEGVRVNGSWFGSTATMKLRNHSLAYDKVQQLTVLLSESNKVATPKVLLLGTSITQATVDPIASKFAGYGVQPVFVGTRTNGGVNRGEGRGSWQGGDYVYSVKDNGHAPLPIGAEAQAMSLGNDTRNPFIRVATGSDDPADVKNGYVYDFGFYLQRFSAYFSAPDIVKIELGPNDFIYQGNAQGLINAKEAIRIIVKSIKAAVPECKIGIEVLQPATKNARWKDAYTALILDNIATYGNRASEGIYVLNSHIYTTGDFIFPTNKLATDPVTGQTSEEISDDLHSVNTPFGASLFAEATFQFIHAIS